MVTCSDTCRPPTLRVRFALVVASLATVVCTAGSNSALATSPPHGSGRGVTSVLVALEGPSVWRALVGSGLAAGPSPRVAGTGVVLDDRHTLAPSTVLALADAVARRQAPVRRAIEALGARIVDAYQTSQNGMLVHASAAQADAMVALPGVAGIHTIPLWEPDLAESGPHVRADQARQDLDYDGSGATVAVVDSGVDYMHASLGGHGWIDEYQANDENVVEAGSFPTAKVVGGFDFAGQRYSPNCALLPFPLQGCDREPTPDADPLEPPELNHGTPVAAVIAGSAIARVASGIAPGARLVALKVFGNPVGAPPATDLLPSALEWVVDHNLGLPVPGAAPPEPIDVLNLSLGYPWAAGLPPIDEAVAAAVGVGVTVVAAAGDSGAVPYSASQPGAARFALAVGSSVPPGRADKVVGVSAHWVVDGVTQTLTAPHREANFTPPLSRTGAITATVGWYGLACNDPSGVPVPPAQPVEGRIALIARGECTFFDKLTNAAAAGAVAAVVVATDQKPAVMTCEAPSDCENPPAIPAVMIALAPGDRVRDALATDAIVTMSMGPDLEVDEENITDTMTASSSRGPTRHGLMRPQIVAPGESIVSARAGSGDWAAARSGTSLAAPFASGAAALLVQRNASERLGLGATDIAALLINQADPVVRLDNVDTGPIAAVERRGAGRLNVWRSSRALTLVTSESGLAELSFDHVAATSGTTVRRELLTVRNLATEGRSYESRFDLTFPAEDANKGVQVAVQPNTFTLAAGASRVVTVTVTVSAADLAPWALRGFGAVSTESIVQRQEVDGLVSIVPLTADGDPVDTETARVPLAILAHRYSDTDAGPDSPLLYGREGDSITWPIANRGAIESQVEAFRLVGTDPLESIGNGAFPASIDIRAVGLRLAPDPSNPDDWLLEWAIAMRGTHRLPIEAEYTILLDTDRDGTLDWTVFNRLGRQVIQLPEIANRWVVFDAPIEPDALSPDTDDVSLTFHGQRFDLDETVATIQVGAANLGLDPSAGRLAFDFAVVAADASLDHALGPGFDGSDYAPDGLADGAAFTYDSAVCACLQLEGADDGASTPTRSTLVPAGSILSLSVRLTCEPEPPATAGFLLSIPGNAPDSSRFVVREWRSHGPGSPVYLPTNQKGDR